MPRVDGKVLDAKIEGNAMLMKAQLNGKLPPVGMLISIKWGAKHTDRQRGLYFVFLQWLIDNGLRELGHFSTDALHDDLKAALKEQSIADFNKLEMGEWVEKVNLFAIEFFEIDTSPFWESYEKDWKA
jgi:hypothetical protein